MNKLHILYIGGDTVKHDYSFDLSGVLLVISGVLCYFFGDFNIPLQVLLVVMAIDYITGVVKSFYAKTISSAIGFKGLLKKFTLLFIVILAYQLERLINQSMIRDMACLFYIANESLSIIENLVAMGIDAPEWLVKRFSNMKKDNDEDKK